MAKIHLNDVKPIFGPLLHDLLIYDTGTPSISSLGLHGKVFLRGMYFSLISYFLGKITMPFS